MLHAVYQHLGTLERSLFASCMLSEQLVPAMVAYLGLRNKIIHMDRLASLERYDTQWSGAIPAVAVPGKLEQVEFMCSRDALSAAMVEILVEDAVKTGLTKNLLPLVQYVVEHGLLSWTQDKNNAAIEITKKYKSWRVYIYLVFGATSEGFFTGT